jgi:predicted Fe-Mo cluster-binding NifX family protein
MDRVSPVWDVARQLQLNEVKAHVVHGRSMVSIARMDRTAILLQLEVDVLICGAISRLLEHACRASGITVHSQVRGNADEVVAAFLAGQLEQPRFRLPGTRRPRRSTSASVVASASYNQS